MNFEEKVIEALTELKVDVKDVKTRLGGVENHLDRTDAKVDGLGERLDRTDAKVDGLAETVSKQGVVQEKLIQSAIKTESGINELLEWKGEMTVKVDGIVDCLEGLAQHHNTMDGEVAALHSRTDRHEGRITRLEQGAKLTTA